MTVTDGGRPGNEAVEAVAKQLDYLDGADEFHGKQDNRDKARTIIAALDRVRSRPVSGTEPDTKLDTPQYEAIVTYALRLLESAPTEDWTQEQLDRIDAALAGFSVDAGQREGYRLASLGTPPPTPEPDTAKLVGALRTVAAAEGTWQAKVARDALAGFSVDAMNPKPKAGGTT